MNNFFIENFPILISNGTVIKPFQMSFLLTSDVLDYNALEMKSEILNEWKNTAFVPITQQGYEELNKLDELGVISLCAIPLEDIINDLFWFKSLIESQMDSADIKCHILIK